MFIVWAKSEAHDGAIRGFVLDKGVKGHSAPKIESELSLRTSITGKISVDGVVVGDDAILPRASGLNGPFSCLTGARYAISWGSVGAAEECRRLARQYGLDGKQFGRPLAQMQLYRKKLADMQTEIALGLQAPCGRGGRWMTVAWPLKWYRWQSATIAEKPWEWIGKAGR